MNELTIAQKQMIEVVKALSLDASLIVMDEPTSALTEREVETLFDQMHRLRQEGVSTIFISHRLEEVFRVADRLTVLRDGRLIGTSVIGDVREDEVVTMMVGRELAREGRRTPKSTDELVLQVEHLQCGEMVHDVSFGLRRGEILGIAGLVGAGRTALLEAIFGSRRIKQGSFFLDGDRVEISSPAKAIRLGIGFVSEDRKAQGLFMNMAVRNNIVMSALKFLTRFGVVLRQATGRLAQTMVDRLDIRTPSLQQRVRNLSGGNQQKVIMARWLALEPKVLLLDEPTRGIDVGAKSEIHSLLDRMVTSGVAILMVSSELPEVLSICDRILVMREGKIVAELDPMVATQDDVMRAAAGSRSDNNNPA